MKLYYGLFKKHSQKQSVFVGGSQATHLLIHPLNQSHVCLLHHYNDDIMDELIDEMEQCVLIITRATFD